MRRLHRRPFEQSNSRLAGVVIVTVTVALPAFVAIVMVPVVVMPEESVQPGARTATIALPEPVIVAEPLLKVPLLPPEH